MKTIFVVFGSTGEYSDRSEWPVAAYTNEDDAKQHVVKATEYAESWHKYTRTEEWGEMRWTPEGNAKQAAANPMDPSFSCDYTGTEYWYAPLELKHKFTAPEAIQ